MTEELKYANQWNISSKYFYEKNYYSWMADKLEAYSTILEIGCGTGYSTLALIKKGHRVIAIDKNADCIAQAKKLISDEGYDGENVLFIVGDIAHDEFREELIAHHNFDVVICWNVGTYWNREMIEHYLPYMMKYGLSGQQILENPESSYSELIIWDTCLLAKSKGVAAHIVDRGVEIINEETDPYYYVLKDELHFSKIEYDNKLADSISSSGRMLSTNGQVKNENKISIIFVSVLYT